MGLGLPAESPTEIDEGNGGLSDVRLVSRPQSAGPAISPGQPM